MRLSLLPKFYRTDLTMLYSCGYSLYVITTKSPYKILAKFFWVYATASNTVKSRDMSMEHGDSKKLAYSGISICRIFLICLAKWIVCTYHTLTPSGGLGGENFLTGPKACQGVAALGVRETPKKFSKFFVKNQWKNYKFLKISWIFRENLVKI